VSIRILFSVFALAFLAEGLPVGGEPGERIGSQDRFKAAQAHFAEGRAQQRLHRNTEASRRELEAAFAGFRAAVDSDPSGALAARALYMSGSTKLFLDEPEAAVTIYAEVVDRYPEDRSYVAKALVKRASVEKGRLQSEAARKTLRRYRDEFPDGGPEDLRREVQRIESSLEIIDQPAPPVVAARWFNASPGAMELDGRVVLVYFWASWCPNCKKEVAFVNDLQARFGGRGLHLVGVTNHSRGQTDEVVESYISSNGFTFPVAVDRQGETSRTMRGGSVPAAVLIDRNGRIRWHDHPAALSDDVLERLLSSSSGEGA
jgi:cytochrome c biogenesis protein CcmG, thiol:disulfide interchange protein DsbE